MATNRALKQALLTKLGVQPPALSKRVKRKKLQTPMSTEEATYLIAHEEGIQIDKYLDATEVSRIRELHGSSRPRGDAAMTPRRTRSRSGTGQPRELRFPGDITVKNALLPPGKLNEAVAMARVYPLLYVFENSIRELIKRVMASEFGDDWWETQLTRGNVQNVYQKAKGRKDGEKKNRWHQKRGSHPIDYVDIWDLATIILGKQDHFFPHIISERPWFEQFMKETYPSRNVVCHMNPLDTDHVNDIKLKIRKWDRMMTANLANIPA